MNNQTVIILNDMNIYNVYIILLKGSNLNVAYNSMCRVIIFFYCKYLQYHNLIRMQTQALAYTHTNTFLSLLEELDPDHCRPR